MLIKIPQFFREDGLKFLVNNNVTSVLVPLDSVTKSTLANIETFVQANVESEKYKPLWLKDSMYVNISKWCSYFLIAPDGSRQPLPVGMNLACGMYNLELHVSHVYIGPHKGGETYSLSLHITELTYEPKQSITDIMEEIVNPTQSPPVSVSQPISKPKQRRSRKGVPLDEIDGPKRVF